MTGASWTRAQVGAVMWDLVRLGPGSTAFVARDLSTGSARVSALRNEERGIYRIDLPAGTVTPARAAGDGIADVVVFDSSGHPQPPSAPGQVPGWWPTGGTGVSLARHSWIIRDPAGPRYEWAPGGPGTDLVAYWASYGLVLASAGSAPTASNLEVTAGRLTISVAVHSATLPRPLARAIASLLSLFFPGERPPALLLLADGADGSNRLAELLSTMLPAGSSIAAPGGRRKSLSDGTSKVLDVPEDRMWVRYVAGWSPRPDFQMPAAHRIASYFPDEDGPGEDLYQEYDEDGDPNVDSQDDPMLEPRQPSAAVVLADDQGRHYPLTPFAVRRWVADNGVDLPESGVFAKQLLDVLYPDEPAAPRVYLVDEAAAFVQHVRDRLRDDLQLGQDLVLEAVREASRWIGRRFRPGQYVYVGLGRSPAAIIAALRQLNPHVQTANIPLTDFQPGPAEHGSILAAFLDEPPASSEQLARLHRHFEEFLGGLPADRPILLIDYIRQGHSLVSAQHYLQRYLDDIGRSQVVHALAIYDATDEPMSGVEAIGIPVDGEPAGTVAARRQWASRFGVLPLGADGPLGELLSEALADALAYHAFDGTAEYGPYRLLAESARSFEEGRPRRGPDAQPAYGILSEAVAGQVRLGSGLGEAMEQEPEPGQPGIADLGAAGRYLRASQVELHASVSYAQARGWLAAVVAGAAVASHPAGAAEGPGNGGEVSRALLLLGGLAEPAYYFNARLGGAELDLYQPGAVVTAAGLTVGLVDQARLSDSENARFVVLPLAGRAWRTRAGAGTRACCSGLGRRCSRREPVSSSTPVRMPTAAMGPGAPRSCWRNPTPPGQGRSGWRMCSR